MSLVGQLPPVSIEDVGPYQRERFLEVSTEPVRRMVCAVDAFGPGAGKGPDDSLWSFQVRLLAFKVEGRLVVGRLQLWRAVDDESQGRLSEAMKPYSLLAVDVRMPRGLEPPDHAWIEAVIGPAEDAELEAEIARSKEPVTFDDPLFGTFVLDRRLDWLVAPTSWSGAPVELVLTLDDPDAGPEVRDALLADARALWADPVAWTRRVHAHAVAELLPLKNDAWLDEGEGPLDASAFLARMKLRSIHVGPEGRFEFWHDDGDLFFGHSILISGTIKEGPTDADIPG